MAINHNYRIKEDRKQEDDICFIDLASELYILLLKK